MLAFTLWPAVITLGWLPALIRGKISPRSGWAAFPVCSWFAGRNRPVLFILRSRAVTGLILSALRAGCRAVTGLILSALRAWCRAVTGLILSALRAWCRAVTGLILSALRARRGPVAGLILSALRAGNRPVTIIGTCGSSITGDLPFRSACRHAPWLRPMFAAGRCILRTGLIVTSRSGCRSAVELALGFVAGCSRMTGLSWGGRSKALVPRCLTSRLGSRSLLPALLGPGSTKRWLLSAVTGTLYWFSAARFSRLAVSCWRFGPGRWLGRLFYRRNILPGYCISFLLNLIANRRVRQFFPDPAGLGILHGTHVILYIQT